MLPMNRLAPVLYITYCIMHKLYRTLHNHSGNGAIHKRREALIFRYGWNRVA